jgi:hypothetical protein
MAGTETTSAAIRATILGTGRGKAGREVVGMSVLRVVSRGEAT